MPFFVAIGVAIAKLFGIGVAAAGASAAGAGLISVATAAAIGSAVVGTAVSAALSLAGRLFQRRVNPARPSVRNTVRAAISPQRELFGQWRTGGQLIYWGSRQRVARAAYLMSNGECESIEGCWIRGDWVALSRTADSAGDLLVPVTGSDYSGKVAIREYFAADGTQGTHMQTTPSYPSGSTFIQQDGTSALSPNRDTAWLQFANPDYQEDDPLNYDAADQNIREPWTTDYPEWTSEHKVNGRSWVFVEFTQPSYDDIKDRFWAAPGPPPIHFLVKGRKLAWPGQSTATWTRNDAAIYYWHLTERKGIPAADIDTASFTAAYNRCEADVTVTLPAAYSDYSATSKRYAFDGFIDYAQSDEEVEENLDAAWAGGEYVEHSGSILFRPGDDRASVLTIDDDLIIGPPAIEHVPALEDRVNAVDCVLTQSSEHEYSEFVLNRFIDTDSESIDGELRVHKLPLENVTDPIAAARTQRSIVLQNRARRLVSVTCRPGDNLELLEDVIPTDTVTFGSEAYGISDDTYFVQRMVFHLNGNVTLALRRVIADTFSDDLILPPRKGSNFARLPDPSTVALDDPTGLALAESTVIADDGAAAVGLDASWVNSEAPVTEVQWRLSEPNPNYDSSDADSMEFLIGEWSESVAIRGSAAGRMVPGVKGVKWAVRVRHVREGNASLWVREEVTVSRDTVAPGAITNLDMDALPAGTVAYWTLPGDDDFLRCDVFLSENESTLDESTHFYQHIPSNRLYAPNLTVGSTYRIWVRAVDRSGNEGQIAGPAMAVPTTLAAASANILAGTGAPADTLGVDGDLYIQDTGQLWQKDSGTWTDTGINLSGSTGAAWHDVMSWPPSASLGAEGDWAIVTSGVDEGDYGTKLSSGWELEGNLKGSKGDKGDTPDAPRVTIIYRFADTEPSEAPGTFDGTDYTPPAGWAESIPSGTGTLWIQFIVIDPNDNSVTSEGVLQPRGADGATPEAPIVRPVHRRAAAKPAIAAGSYSGGVYTPAASWGVAIPSGSGILWQQWIVIDPNDGSARSEGVFQAEGQDGEDGDDGETPDAPVVLAIYTRSESEPSEAPGTYDGTDYTPPTGWTEAVPSGDDQLWGQFIVIDPNDNSVLSEGVLRVEGQDGDDGVPPLALLFRATYQRSDTEPAEGAGTYDGTTYTHAGGWSDDGGTGDETLWLQYVIIDPNDNSVTSQGVLQASYRDGTDGTDGNGYERVFAVYDSETLPASKRPSDSWGFDEPDASDGLQWEDSAPDQTESNPVLYLSERPVTGVPATGADVPGQWTVPGIIGRYGADGLPGIAYWLRDVTVGTDLTSIDTVRFASGKFSLPLIGDAVGLYHRLDTGAQGVVVGGTSAAPTVFAWELTGPGVVTAHTATIGGESFTFGRYEFPYSVLSGSDSVTGTVDIGFNQFVSPPGDPAIGLTLELDFTDSAPDDGEFGFTTLEGASTGRLVLQNSESDYQSYLANLLIDSSVWFINEDASRVVWRVTAAASVDGDSYAYDVRVERGVNAYVNGDSVRVHFSQTFAGEVTNPPEELQADDAERVVTVSRTYRGSGTGVDDVNDFKIVTPAGHSGDELLLSIGCGDMLLPDPNDNSVNEDQYINGLVVGTQVRIEDAGDSGGTTDWNALIIAHADGSTSPQAFGPVSGLADASCWYLIRIEEGDDFHLTSGTDYSIRFDPTYAPPGAPDPSGYSREYTSSAVGTAVQFSRFQPIASDSDDSIFLVIGCGESNVDREVLEALQIGSTIAFTHSGDTYTATVTHTHGITIHGMLCYAVYEVSESGSLGLSSGTTVTLELASGSGGFSMVAESTTLVREVEDSTSSSFQHTDRDEYSSITDSEGFRQIAIGDGANDVNRAFLRSLPAGTRIVIAAAGQAGLMHTTSGRRDRGLAQSFFVTLVTGVAIAGSDGDTVIIVITPAP